VKHEAPLRVTCPTCLREKDLTVQKRNAEKFVGEWCDGAAGARHPMVAMLGPEGEKNA